MAIILPSDGKQIVVSAILTKAGRQKLASGVEHFKIVKFAVADDQVDYGIQNLQQGLAQNSLIYPILQPINDGDLMMNYKLYTSPAVNAGSNILVQISIDGLTQQAQNLLSSDNTSQVVYAPNSFGYFGGKQMYTIGIQFTSREIPFESIHYYLDGWHVIDPMPISGFSIANAERIKFIRKPLVNDSLFKMNIFGNITGARAQYNLKVLQASQAANSGQQEIK